LSRFDLNASFGTAFPERSGIAIFWTDTLMFQFAAWGNPPTTSAFIGADDTISEVLSQLTMEYNTLKLDIGQEGFMVKVVPLKSSSLQMGL